MAPTGKNAGKKGPTEKQPKAKVARYLKSQEAQINEGVKASLLLKGTRCSEVMGHVLKDLRAMKAPASKLLTKKNEINLFDNSQSIEFLCTKNDCSTFALASHNKKRPNNLVFGRTFDNELLDAVEVGVENYKGLNFFKGAPKKRVGSKPMFLFVGDKWTKDETLKKFQNLILDWFRGDPVDSLSLKGLDHVIQVTAIEAKVYFRTYYVKLKKNPSGDKAPLPLLTRSGPDWDMTIRRTQFASPDMWKSALKMPKALTKKKTKNQKTNAMGETIGRIHLERQDIDRATGRKTKAIRIAEATEKREEQEAIDEEAKREEEAEGNMQYSDDSGDGVGGEEEEEEEEKVTTRRSKRRKK
ncbi:hypothetical protein TL16_g02908 [Triparma laevis f. inornata]|uniref:Ribosome production factor 2 homolog n=1 Tax=Triparma laevis f. inornata TaxID=1714386 RepID=A0A9W7DZJ6_9STRA|nr:hypothetical protein TL16_g02908 [Triparma laevis f. inornata]